MVCKGQYWRALKICESRESNWFFQLVHHGETHGHPAYANIFSDQAFTSCLLNQVRVCQIQYFCPFEVKVGEEDDRTWRELFVCCSFAIIYSIVWWIALLIYVALFALRVKAKGGRQAQDLVHYVYTSIHKYTQVYTSIHKYTQVYSSIHK